MKSSVSRGEQLFIPIVHVQWSAVWRPAWCHIRSEKKFRLFRRPFENLPQQGSGFWDKTFLKISFENSLKTIMIDLQSTFEIEFNVTSSHKLRRKKLYAAWFRLFSLAHASVRSKKCHWHWLPYTNLARYFKIEEMMTPMVISEVNF